MIKNNELFNSKKEIVEKLSADWSSLQADCSNKISTYYHGIPVTFHFISKEQLEKFTSFLPSSWKNVEYKPSETPFNLYFFTPEGLGNSYDWEAEQDPDCHIEYVDSFEQVIQRDFVGVVHNDHNISVVVNSEIMDGFFNIMRWFLPRKMLLNDQVILHSSCVVGKDDLAYFFLGYSGAGKSTVASFAGDRLVLGDDMNLLSRERDQFFASAGALGGYSSKEIDYSKKYKVGGFFWLEKSDNVEKIKSSPTRSAMKIVTSCSNLSWSDPRQELEGKVLSFATFLANQYTVYDLKFKKDEEFWNHVE